MGQENTAPRKINGVSGVEGQVMQSGGPGAVETWAPMVITPLGGIAIQIINKTGVASVKGTGGAASAFFLKSSQAPNPARPAPSASTPLLAMIHLLILTPLVS